jgi:hypothetical protein
MALGVGAWSYVRLQRRTGASNSKAALTGAAFIAAAVFIMFLTIGLTLL